jgi:hypothetical protein
MAEFAGTVSAFAFDIIFLGKRRDSGGVPA